MQSQDGLYKKLVLQGLDHQNLRCY